MLSVYSGSDWSNQTVSLNADGSADFAGTVDVGGDALAGANVGITLNSFGAVHAARSAGNEVVFAGYTQGDSVAGTYIYADGSSEFAGNIDVNGGINGAGASIFADGRVYGRTTYAQGGINGLLFQGLQADGTEVFRIATDGSAIFQSTLQAEDYNFENLTTLP